MTLPRAIAYFCREAAVNLLRSWKVSLLAVLTIAVSLFIGGVFLLVGDNLARLVAGWRREARVVVYLEPGLGAPESAALAERLLRTPWIGAVEEVSGEEAEARFREAFPSLSDLLEGWSEDPLPPSLEVSFDPEAVPARGLEQWLAALRAEPEVRMVDDDRDWLRQLEAIVALLRGVGITLGGVLLGAAVFTIASVIRLTAFLYREEIGILRLVGATELFIRGPFYAEGLIQGLVGGLLAVAGLAAGWAAFRPRAPGDLLPSLLAASFLPWQKVALILALGAAAGLTGAVVSLRRERAASAA